MYTSLSSVPYVKKFFFSFQEEEEEEEENEEEEEEEEEEPTEPPTNQTETQYNSTGPPAGCQTADAEISCRGVGMTHLPVFQNLEVTKLDLGGVCDRTVVRTNNNPL